MTWADVLAAAADHARAALVAAGLVAAPAPLAPAVPFEVEREQYASEYVTVCALPASGPRECRRVAAGR